MKINFFGNSLCAPNNTNKFPTWLDRVVEKYSADRDYLGIACCSEERILFNLKKAGDFDLAIIMHGNPNFIFCPTLEKDFHKDPGWAGIHLEDRELKYSPNGYNDMLTAVNEKITLPSSETKNLVEIYQKYFFTPETNRNRFYGALIQIEQYLNFKKIPAIHCPQHQHDIPKWFTFNSGPALYDIASMQHDSSPYSCSYNKSANAVTEEGNQIIFEKIDLEIQKLIKN